MHEKDYVVPLANEVRSPWLLSLARWLLGDFVGSMHALMQTSEASSTALDKRYTLIRGGADLDPVIMYYSEHLLQSSAELKKMRQLDLAAAVSMRRKTVFATFNSGCIIHSLARLINDSSGATAAPAARAAMDVAAPVQPAPETVAVGPKPQATSGSELAADAPLPVLSMRSMLMAPAPKSDALAAADAAPAAPVTSMRSLLMPPPRKAVAKKVSNTAATGTMMFGAFDDGFGDLPTPAWALPAQAASSSAAPSAMLAPSASVTSVAAASTELDLRRELEMDLAMKWKVAVAYLLGLEDEVAERCALCRRGEWGTVSHFLQDSARFLAQRLGLEEGALVARVRAFVHHRQLCRFEFALLPDAPSRLDFFDAYCGHILRAIEGALNVEPSELIVFQVLGDLSLWWGGGW
jgi:hypothetical protein